MKVSIAMTTYNGEKYVEEQLNSLLNQTRKPDEVIIFDDHSTDDTPNIVRKFINDNEISNWFFYVNEKNLGYKENFYKAILKTTGDIIFLCDQDDIWYYNKIDVMIDKFLRNGNIKVLNTSFEYIDGENKKIDIVLNEKYSNNNLIKIPVENNDLIKIPFKDICCYGISPGCTMAFTKEIKDIYIKNSQLKIVHDWEINFIGAIYDSLYFFNIKTIKYRIHGDNVMGITDVNGKLSFKDKLDIKNRLAEVEKNYFISINLKGYYDFLSKEKKSSLDDQVKFNELRLNAFKDRSIFTLLKVYKYYGIYKKSNSLKGRLADLVCLFFPKKLLKKGV